MFDIVTIGSATGDAFLRGAELISIKSKKFITGEGICFSAGSKVEVSEIYFSTGGGATNTAITFSRQGLKTAAVFRIGKDQAGEKILAELKKEKVDASFVQFDYSFPTAYSVVLVKKDGERTILTYKGAIEKLTSWEVPWKKIKTKWLLLGSLGEEKDILKNFIEFALDNKINLAINPSGKELRWLKNNPSWLKYFKIFICNQEEASYLTDISYQQEKKLFKKLDGLIEGIVAMTKGEKGVSVSNGKILWRAGVFKPTKTIDQTGAGDAFASGFTSVFVKSNKFDEKAIEKAIRVGSINAASVIKYIGPKKGILTLKELNELMSRKFVIKKTVI